MSFCHSILCLCHVWVKLCAEQLRGSLYQPLTVRLWQIASTEFWGKLATDFGKICHRLWKIHPANPPTLGKSVTDSWEIRRQFWGKSITDFGKISRHRLWENPSPILRKPVTDFGEIRHRFCGNPSPILGKSATDFGDICHRFQGNLPSILGKITSTCYFPV